MQTAEVVTREDQKIPPLVCNEISVPGSTVVFSAACFEGNDWSLGPLQAREDVPQNPRLVQRVNDALAGLGVEAAYAPNPTAFNGKVIYPPELDRALKLGSVYLYRNQSRPADATFLHYRRTAGVFSAGGCGMLVIAYKDQLMFGHAGRESLIDRRRVETEGQEGSRPKDLVDNMLDALKIKPGEESLVHAWPLYFIKPENFVHRLDGPDPKHIPYNQGAWQYLRRTFAEFGWVDDEAVYIDLPKIAKSQLLQRGVLEENVHLEHAYLADELPTTRNGGGRYLAAVVRHR